MTDNEIIKALECCATYEFCTGCPLVDNCPSNYSLLKPALDLINRQKAEKKALIAGQETLQEHIAKQKAEIESKNDLIHRQSDVISEQKEKLESIYSEAVKEFAERLKTNTVTLKVGKQNCRVITVDGIDYFKKEMVGEE